MNEDLTEYENVVDGGGAFRMRLEGEHIEFSIKAFSDYRIATASIPQSEVFHHKLGQMIAYYKRTKGETK